MRARPNVTASAMAFGNERAVEVEHKVQRRHWSLHDQRWTTRARCATRFSLRAAFTWLHPWLQTLRVKKNTNNEQWDVQRALQRLAPT